jgi:hypothetical protein
MNIKPLGTNVTLLVTNHGYEILYSYETPVAGYSPLLGWFRTTQRYSNTTTRHINKYLEKQQDVINVSPEDIELMGKTIAGE